MKKQTRIIIIPGWDTIEFHENRKSKFFSKILILIWRTNFLHIWKILHHILKNRVDWIVNLQKRISTSFQVSIYHMPYRHFAKYSEWKSHFEKHIKQHKRSYILIWYSLWGNFLVKYLSEHPEIHKNIQHVYLVGTFYNITNPKDYPEYECFRTWYNSQFQFHESALQNLSQLPITFYQWTEDCIVSAGNFELFKKYMNKMPNKKFYLLKNKDHMDSNSYFWIMRKNQFPELIKDIKKL